MGVLGFFLFALSCFTTICIFLSKFFHFQQFRASTSAHISVITKKIENGFLNTKKNNLKLYIFIFDRLLKKTMENLFRFKNNKIMVVKSRDDRLDNIMARRPVVLADTILDSTSKLNSSEVEALLDDQYTTDVIPKQIIVEKMDDFIQEGEFEDLSIVNGEDPLSEREFAAENGNITIVSDVFHNSVGETHIISDQEAEMESSLNSTGFFEDAQSLEEVSFNFFFFRSLGEFYFCIE